MTMFIAKKMLQQLICNRAFNGYKAVILHHQSTHFKFFISSTALNSSSSFQSDDKGDDFTVSYLVNSCGVSIDVASKISEKIQLKSAEKPSRTLNLLRSYGFTDAQISSIVTVAPKVLHSDPVKTLKPKFDLLVSLGASNDDMFKIISNCPGILRMNLEKSLMPALDLIKSVVVSNEELITLLARFWILRNTLRTFGPNVAYLRDIGMPGHSISRFIMLNGNSLKLNPVKFKLMADRALAMGFDVENTSFGGAINALTALTEEKWERKVDVFMKWGWSETEFKMAFRKQPRIMLLSEEKINGIMDYLINEMGQDANFLVKYPYALLLSLKKRIVPRCTVLQVLLSKELIDKDYSLNSLLISTDEYFLKAFVEKKTGARTELVALYHSLKD